MTDQRFIERARQDRRRKLKRIGLGVLIVTAAGALGWLVWFSSVLAVSEVKVGGLTTLTESRILTVAQVPEGEPLARVDLTQIEERVASLERVSEVSVSRSWPRAISIEVVERKAVMWSTIGGRVRGIDRDGIDFRSYRKGPDDLVEATISITDADQRLETTQSVASVVDLVTRKDRALREQVRTIGASTKDSIEIGLTKGRTVVWGSAADGERKLRGAAFAAGHQGGAVRRQCADQPTTRQ
ncbi:cell division protein FtsQ/DivIB [Aeromicrobium sp. UC242_57]|uniref:cell division protein FtsQ/DivIB n=1 Tax=Aeromicrobium sp. UC242_57 TaxID=3374624 RepID=UPI0037ADA6E0